LDKIVLLFDSVFFEFLANNLRDDCLKKKIFKYVASLLKNKIVVVCLNIIEQFFSIVISLPIPIYATIIKIIINQADGFTGYYLRAMYYSRKLKGFYGNVIMEKNVVLKKPQNYSINRFVLLDIDCKILCDEAIIESGCHLAVNSLITGGGCLVMKKYSGLGHNSIIITATDTIEGGYRSSGPMIPQQQRRVIRTTTTIEKDAWPSTNVIIFPGVTVAEGSVLAPGSIVMKDTQPWSVWAPPRIKKYGFREKVKFDDPQYIKKSDFYRPPEF
jgi:acetyltransferase-like isoleucine patch superfamily enzyme